MASNNPFDESKKKLEKAKKTQAELLKELSYIESVESKLRKLSDEEEAQKIRKKLA